MTQREKKKDLLRLDKEITFMYRNIFLGNLHWDC